MARAAGVLTVRRPRDRHGGERNRAEVAGNLHVASRRRPPTGLGGSESPITLFWKIGYAARLERFQSLLTLMMLQSTAISQRLPNHIAGWTGNPIRGRKGYEKIDLARCHVQCMASMSSNEREFPC